jgi:hypothetical protein
VSLRNKVVHQGYFPTEEESRKYGSSVLEFISTTIALLAESPKHAVALISAINDQGDFSLDGPRVHHYADPYIGTNRSPSTNNRTLEQLLAAARRGRRRLDESNRA